ncbi:MAG: AMP-binding protein [Chloroflexi bacterium]|nr:AMP-binding protein [Chloroflexota bacterium]
MNNPFDFGGPFVWQPTAAYTDRSNLLRFMRQHGLATLEDLQRRSTEDVAWFTEAVIEFLGIQFQRPYTAVVDLSNGIQRPRWCVDGQLNIATNCVDKWADNPATRSNTAVIWEGEEGQTRTLTYAELHAQVNQCVNALRGLGLKAGDGIGLHLPMCPEIVIALLAIAKLGGIVIPLFSGFGAGAISTRLNDPGAKALFTADGFFRRGKVTPLKTTADQALADVPTIEHVIVLRRTGQDVPLQAGRDVWWHEMMAGQSEEAEAAVLDAETTLMLIYTSGTTGKPKGTVHTHCGFPIKAAQDMAFGTDVQQGDVIHWVTDMGWMMGPWLVFGSLLLGSTCFLYDGSPDWPQPDRLWAMVERHRITHLGISPTLIRALIPHGDEMATQHDLSSIHLFASTGEPWNPAPWLWLFNVVGKGQRPIINYSGGTEIAGGIVMGNPLQPLKPAAFAGPCPGIAADVVDENGRSLRNAVGELVIRAPWIGMTRGFWQDEQRYLDTYWSRWPDVWVHGDWAAVDNDGQWYILGRSDDTVNVAGKRIGPAEMESILVNHAAVAEAAAIGIPDEVKGSAIVCFCVLFPGQHPSDELRRELIHAIADQMGKPLQPKEIWFVADLPKTRSAKVMRRIIRAAYLGENPGDTSSLLNPEAVAEVSLKK